MNIRPLLRKILSSFVLLTMAKKCRDGSSLLKIKAAQGYVLGVKKMRLFFLGVMFIVLALGFLANGLFLVQSAFFTYSMWSNEVKFSVALIFGGIQLFGGLAVLMYLFREETWGRFTGIHHVVKMAIDE